MKNIDGVGQLEPHVDVFTTQGTRKQIRVDGDVDASGVTTDGQPFSGVEEFRQRLLSAPQMLAENLARQLTIYATGTGYHFH